MESHRRDSHESRDEAKAAPLPPTPTQAENDAAMIAATGGENAPGPPPTDGGSERKPAESTHTAPTAHHDAERREHR